MSAVTSVNNKTGAINLRLDDLAPPVNDVLFGGRIIKNVADPVDPSDVGTKKYIDASIANAIAKLQTNPPQTHHHYDVTNSGNTLVYNNDDDEKKKYKHEKSKLGLIINSPFEMLKMVNLMNEFLKMKLEHE